MTDCWFSLNDLNVIIVVMTSQTRSAEQRYTQFDLWRLEEAEYWRRARLRSRATQTRPMGVDQPSQTTPDLYVAQGQSVRACERKCMLCSAVDDLRMFAVPSQQYSSFESRVG
jgi:hypothetical protein